MSDNLPSELQQFVAILDAQTSPVQIVFQYAMCLFMVEAGKIRLVETRRVEPGAICVFETLSEDSFTFSVTKPPVSKETEAALVWQSN